MTATSEMATTVETANQSTTLPSDTTDAGNADTTSEVTTTRPSATDSRCMCVPTGSCPLVGGNATYNDGSGLLDPRIANVS